MELIRKVLDFAADLLKGEPARVIGYGGAAIFYFAAKYVGAIPDVSFDEAVIQVAAIVVTVGAIVETIRSLVTPVAKLPEDGKDIG